MNVDDNFKCGPSIGAFEAVVSKPQRESRAATRRIGMIATAPPRLNIDVRTRVTARAWESS
ncbi:hypothetical protein [Burkholderia contaminans]|uniref:hypothetical protein n=1 Tax=Burkholderia contaminans TaxID=488447 RepID=UPI00117C2184|nr:hypothetical protein [Burkholderia contaminans]